jgi:hypothetical protein
MSWYDRVVESSVRDDKKKQVTLLMKELGKAQEGCHIDHLTSEEAVISILKRMERKQDRFLIPEELLSYVTESLSQAKKVIRDSPDKFVEVLEDAMIYLDEYLYELELKG